MPELVNILLIAAITIFRNSSLLQYAKKIAMKQRVYPTSFISKPALLLIGCVTGISALAQTAEIGSAARWKIQSDGEGVWHVKDRNLHLIGKDESLQLKRSFFPSSEKPLAIEKMVFINLGKTVQKVDLEYMRKETKFPKEKTTTGPYSFLITTINDGVYTIQPGDSVVVGISYQAVKSNEPETVANIRRQGQ